MTATVHSRSDGCLKQRERCGAHDGRNAECDPGQVQMVDAVEGDDVGGKEHVGVQRECRVPANLQYLGITGGTAGFEHQRSWAAGSSHQRGDP